MVLFVLNDLRLEDIACFADIGGTVDHQFKFSCFVDIGGTVDYRYLNFFS